MLTLSVITWAMKLEEFIGSKSNFLWKHDVVPTFPGQEDCNSRISSVVHRHIYP